MSGAGGGGRGGRFDFDDGGSYSGGWLDGKAHGYGVCTGPKGQGEYAGAWTRGFEESGVYTWPSGNTYSGEWHDGKRNGLGVEIKGHWIYRGDWSHGYKGQYGVRQSTISKAKYEGTWATSFQEGYGVETYVDEGTYLGQWQRGMRHGLGVRRSAPFGIAAQYRDKADHHMHSSMPSAINTTSSSSSSSQTDLQRGRSSDPSAASTDRNRGGFVLTGRSTSGFNDAESRRSRSSSGGRSFTNRFRLKRQQSTGDLPRSIQSSPRSNGNGRALGGKGDVGSNRLLSNVDIEDASVTETYMGEWKADKRSGFGVSERSDGLRYVGEWYNDKKFGYGVTFLKDGTREEGKYKDNELITSGRKRKLFAINKTRVKDRVEAAVVAATKAAETALQKEKTATARKANAKQKAENADKAALKAMEEAELARDEATKYSQPTPITKRVAATPVSHEMRVVQKQEQRVANQPQQELTRGVRSGRGGGVEERGMRMEAESRVLPPRQDSSESYTSNASSFGSSSTPLSPPPPKPPRSPPNVDDPPTGHVTHRTSDVVSGSPAATGNRPQALHPSEFPASVSRTRKSSEPGTDHRGGREPSPMLFPSLSRPTSLENSMDQGRDRPGDAINSKLASFRDFRPNQKPHPNQSDFSDFPDVATTTTRRTPVSHHPGISPHIRLHPPPTSNRQMSSDGGAQFPENEGSQKRTAVDNTRRNVSPVLSDRRYEQETSNERSHLGSDTSRDARDPSSEIERFSSASNSADRRSMFGRRPDQSHPNDTQGQSPYSPALPRSTTTTPHESIKNHRDTPRHRSYQVQSGADSRSPPGDAAVGTHQRHGGLTRRGTMPCVVHYPQSSHVKDLDLGPPPSPSLSSARHPSGEMRRAAPRQTFLVEDGVRRRLLSESSPISSGAERVTVTQPRLLMHQYKLEPVSKLSRHGYKTSLPDVRGGGTREQAGTIPREQISILSQKRRDEIRKEREEMERGTLVIRMADVKAWITDNQLVLFLVALNLTLAAMFFKFLTQGKESTK